MFKRSNAYQRDPSPYYKVSDIFVFPSSSETFGNVLIEAMSHGLAVVTTSVGVVKDWGHAITCVTTFDGNSVSGLLETLEQLIARPSDLNRMGVEAREFVRNRFQVDQVAEQYRQIYSNLLGTQ